MSTAKDLIPRGLQIRAKNTLMLGATYSKRKFHYPKVLAYLSIGKKDWNKFADAVLEPMKGEAGNIPHVLDEMLDIVAEWDINFFRPRGLLMRWDMPGEEKFGIDFMDLYHDSRRHFDNLSTYATSHIVHVEIPSPPNWRVHEGSSEDDLSDQTSKSDSGENDVCDQTTSKTKSIKTPKIYTTNYSHLKKIRQKMFESTRIVLDPIEVLGDPEQARERGWTAWIKACSDAELSSLQKTADTTIAQEDFPNEPWEWNLTMSTRKDRWPASKHLYYDRHRGRLIRLVGRYDSHQIFIPDHDSMDQRGGTLAYPKSVLPADNISPSRVFRIYPTIEATRRRRRDLALHLIGVSLAGLTPAALAGGVIVANGLASARHV